MKFVARALFLLACAAALPATTQAQSTIAGAIVDDTGGLLPGVTVEASSDVLIEGSRIAFTNGAGQYTIVDLRPGTYTVTFSLPGFGTQIREDVVLPGDFTLTLDVTMAVGAVAETITVSGEAPVVDVQRVQRVQTLTRETVEAIPSGGSLWSFAALVPGVKPLRPDIGGSRAMQQNLMFGRGASSRQTTVEVDGMNANTFNDDGRFKQYHNPQMTSEVTFTTSGMNAETGHGGLRMNIIPREGGNFLSGSVFAGGSPRQWSFDNWNERLGNLGVRGPDDAPGSPSGVPRLARVYDVNGGLGGPILRDKLWFFTSYMDRATDDVTLNATNRDGTPAIDDNRINSAMLRLTWQPAASHKWSAYLDRIFKRRFHQFEPNTDRETASSTTEPNINYYTSNTKYTWTVSNRVLFEAGLSLVGQALRDANQPGITVPRPAEFAQCLSTPCFSASPLQGAFGAPVDPWYANIRRNDDRLGDYTYGSGGLESVTLPYNQSFLASVSYVTGSHNFKVGVVNNRGKLTNAQDGNGDLNVMNYGNDDNPFGHIVPWIGADHINANCKSPGLPCNLIGNPLSVSVRNSPNFNRRDVAFDFAAYAQDSWTLDRLTINAGLRVEFARPRNPAAPKPAGRFSAIGEFPALEGLPDFGPDWAPRLSLVYDVFGNARTAAKFGWNRYYHAYGITGVLPLSSYAGAAGRSDTRDWFDVTLMPGTDTPDGPAGCELVPVGAAGSCNNPYGTNGDNIAQDWEIGLPGNDLFPTGSTIRPDSDLQRRFDDVLTVGLQQELGRGVSVTLEYRRRWTKDQWFRSYDARRFAFENGRFVDNDIWVLEDEFLAPWPYTAIVPVYGIYPAAERIPGQVDITVPGGADYLDRFTGFEASFTARMPGGGTLFGGWNTETPGVGESAGVWNACSMRVAEGDDPNSLRFCNEFAFPRNWRNEFKLSGAQPLPWDLQLGGSFQLYPGWGVTERFRVDRRGGYEPHNYYVAPWYTEENCVAPCVLGERIIRNRTSGQLGTSTTGRTMDLLPNDSVKYLPDWNLLDLNVARVFNVGNWRYEMRFEAFNVFNKGIEMSQAGLGTRGTTLGGQNNDYEEADEVMFGRVLRVSMTARF